MINKNQAIRILNSGLQTGADYAEIYIEEKDSFSVVVENGKVESSAIRRSYGAGIRLLNKLQSYRPEDLHDSGWNLYAAVQD